MVSMHSIDDKYSMDKNEVLNKLAWLSHSGTGKTL